MNFVNNNSAYASNGTRKNYYTKKYEYHSDQMNYNNMGNKKNNVQRSYSGVGEIVKRIHEDNQNSKPPKKDYLDGNLGLSYHDRNSTANFNNTNSYYKNRTFNSANNLSGSNRFRKEKEFVEEEIVKPQFINSQLDSEVHFTDLKQDEDVSSLINIP